MFGFKLPPDFELPPDLAGGQQISYPSYWL